MSGLFALETAHGTTLQADSRTGKVVNTRATSDTSARRLALYIPINAASVGFLMVANDDGTALHITGDPIVARIVPLRLQRERDSLTTALCQPFTGQFLSAIPPASDDEPGDVVINREMRDTWEAFRLLPLDAPVGSPTLTVILQAIDTWVTAPLTGPNVLEIIENGLDPATSYAFEAVARLLPHDQIAWLGPTILGRPTALTNLAAAFPHDLFTARAMPDLSAWLATRPKSVHQHLGSELDDLAETGIDSAHKSFWHMCSCHARRMIPPRRTIAILATARNEGIYLLEWIAYHRSIGIEEFFIYSNDNNDGSDVLLEQLAKSGIITWVSSELEPGHAAQPKAYGHALGIMPHILDNRWTLIIDLDEFFVFDHARFASIRDYIAWQEARPVDAIALNWLVFGSAGEQSWRATPLVSRFIQRLPWVDPHIKTMVRTNQAMHARPHHPSFDSTQTIISRNASGGIHVTADQPSFSAQPETTTAWINHYFLKSADEFVWKFSRNRGDHALIGEASPIIIAPSFADMFARQHGSPTMIMDDRILECAAGQAAQTEYLMSLPGVASASIHVMQRYGEELAKLKHIMRTDPMFRIPDSPHSRLAALFGL